MLTSGCGLLVTCLRCRDTARRLACLKALIQDNTRRSAEQGPDQEGHGAGQDVLAGGGLLLRGAGAAVQEAMVRVVERFPLASVRLECGLVSPGVAAVEQPVSEWPAE